MTKKPITLHNLVWKEGDYYVAWCLNVDVSSFGKSKKKALQNLQEAVELYFDDNDKNNNRILKIDKVDMATFRLATPTATQNV